MTAGARRDGDVLIRSGEPVVAVRRKPELSTLREIWRRGFTLPGGNERVAVRGTEPTAGVFVLLVRQR